MDTIKNIVHVISILNEITTIHIVNELNTLKAMNTVNNINITSFYYNKSSSRLHSGCRQPSFHVACFFGLPHNAHGGSGAAALFRIQKLLVDLDEPEQTPKP